MYTGPGNILQNICGVPFYNKAACLFRASLECYSLSLVFTSDASTSASTNVNISNNCAIIVSTMVRSENERRHKHKHISIRI